MPFYEQITQALGRLFRKYIYGEDPDERRKRLHEEALREIDAQLPYTVQMRLAMRVWEDNRQKNTPLRMQRLSPAGAKILPFPSRSRDL